MNQLSLRSFAKINWTLRIAAKRDDGFHELETIFQTISLHDELRFTRSDRFELTCDDPSIPTGEENLVTRAWQLLAERGAGPVRIELTKRIPAGGGLGGGSSNAATTLRAVRALFALDVSDTELATMALRLGSDVPFFLVGGTAHATGRGEVLTPLPDIPQQVVSLILPPEKVMTGPCYGELARMRAAGESTISAPIGSFSPDDFDSWIVGPAVINDLEAPAFHLVPRLAELKKRSEEAGAKRVLLSGSGSTIFALAPAETLAAALPEETVVEATTVGRAEALALGDRFV